MNIRVDEAEHSMEMHLPYLAKVFEGKPVKIVPILVGALSAENEAIMDKYFPVMWMIQLIFSMCHQTFVTGDLVFYQVKILVELLILDFMFLPQVSNLLSSFSKVLGENCWASYFHQASIGTHLTYRFTNHNNKKRKVSIDRWSAEKYKMAEENMLKVMKAKGDVYGNPIMRPDLRSEARKLQNLY
ncbi:unnamed protein product [Lupinus luteus]|uniref:PTC1-like winged helix-turn-helix domain-containing protein n=1 Tax=Lupinus luteus TaxID=3873 RepID=A0AAV1WZZ1_LUPLU